MKPNDCVCASAEAAISRSAKAPARVRIVLAAANELGRREIEYNSNAVDDESVWLRAMREASKQARVIKKSVHFDFTKLVLYPQIIYIIILLTSLTIIIFSFRFTGSYIAYYYT